MTVNNSTYMWSEAEERVAYALAPLTNSGEISEVLQLLGYHRSPSAVRNKLLYRAEKIDNGFSEEIVPSLYLEEALEEEEFEAAIQVLGADLEIEGYEPEDIDRQLLKEIPTTSQKAKTTTISRELHNKVSSIIFDILKETKENRKLPLSTPSKATGGSLLIHLSDLHLGKLIIDEKGNPLFNAEISNTQFDLLISKILQIIDREENSLTNPIDEIVIVLNGDLIDSETIYETQPFHIEKHVLDQLRLAANLLWDKIIATLHNKNPKLAIRVITCRGNHGRTFGAETTNWDNVIYLIIEVIAKATGFPVETFHSLHEYNTFTIKGHKGLVRHRAPKQDSTPSAQQKYAGWLDVHKFDFMMTGHWHSYGIGGYNGRPIFRNGSLPGSDDLSESMALQNPPMQGAFIITKEDCPAVIYPLNLTFKKK